MLSHERDQPRCVFSAGVETIRIKTLARGKKKKGQFGKELYKSIIDSPIYWGSFKVSKGGLDVYIDCNNGTLVYFKFVLGSTVEAIARVKAGL